jgi:hypothetical protein
MNYLSPIAVMRMSVALLACLAPSDGNCQVALSVTVQPNTDVVPKQNATNVNGYIQADLPWRVSLNRDFTVDLWLVSGTRDFPHATGPVEISMDRTEKVEFDPRSLSLWPGQKGSVEARVIKADSGLAKISASAQDWRPLTATIDVGFDLSLAKLRLKPTRSSWWEKPMWA